MVNEAQPIDISDMPDLVALAREVKQTRTARILQADGEDVAIIAPKTERRALRGKPLTADDPLWQIIGMDASNEGPTDVSEHKQKYLAGASLPKDK